MAGETSRSPRQASEETRTVLAIESLKNEIMLMRKDFDYLKEDMAEVKKASHDGIDEINQMISQFRVTLYGNGKLEDIGLVAIVNNIQKFIDERKVYEKILIAAIIGEMIGMIFLAAKSFFGA